MDRNRQRDRSTGREVPRARVEPTRSDDARAKRKDQRERSESNLRNDRDSDRQRAATSANRNQRSSNNATSKTQQQGNLRTDRRPNNRRRRSRSSSSSKSRSSSLDSKSDGDSDRSDDFNLGDVVESRDIKGKFSVVKSKTINVLFVGRSGSGKTSFIKQVLNPSYTVRSTRGFSDTELPVFRRCAMMFKGKPYQLNMLDTPGLNEFSRSVSRANRRKNEQLIDLSVECIRHNVTQLNAVFFVSKAGYTNFEDLDVFAELVQALGTRFSSNAFLLLTHAEDLTDERQYEYKRSLREQEDCKAFCDYCEKGVYFSGAVNRDHVKRLNERIRQDFATELVLRVKEMRENVLSAIIATADEPRQIEELEFICNKKKEQEKQIIDEAMKNKPCSIM